MPGSSVTEEQKIRQQALRLLSRREFSVEELRTRLGRYSTNHSAVNAEIDRLTSAGLLDDLRAAEIMVRSRAERGHGPLRIRYELGEKGFSKELLDSLMTAEHYDWKELACRARARRFTSLPGSDVREKQRQLRFLQQRGFRLEHCLHAVHADPVDNEH